LVPFETAVAAHATSFEPGEGAAVIAIALIS
jgi:hypothetical protein